MPEQVKLVGGPFDGQEASVTRGAALLVSGDAPNGERVPDRDPARYTATRDRGAYRFRGMDHVVATLPMREAPHA